MLALRARGFALRNAFADALRGLITAEEAQDYPQAEPAREPVQVRPKFDTPVPAAVQVALAPSAIEKARAAVSRASTIDRLEALRTTADERLGDGTFTDDEHKEICSAIHAKLDALMVEAQTR
jgi:hypothetical protein